MSASKKDYDPLSGLFGSRVPGVPLPEVGDDPSGGMPMIDGADAPEPIHLRPRVTPVRRAPPPPKPADPDPAALAKILARAAVAKAGMPALAPPAPAEPPAPPRAEPNAVLSPLSRPVPMPVTPKSAEDLARASAPPAAAAAPPAPPAPPAAAAAAARPAPATPPPAAPGGSRLGALGAPPPKRAVSAAEALDAARISEAAAAAASVAAVTAASAAASASKSGSLPLPLPGAAPAVAAASAPPTLDLTERVQEFLQTAVPGASLYVAVARLAEDRGGLKPLWNGHRARALAAGDVSLALTMAAVLHAISQVPRGALLASLVVQDGQELLVWFDLRTGQVIAVLGDARGWGMAL